MAVVSKTPSNGRMRNGGHHHGSAVTSEPTISRLFLALACVWPLCLLALFSSSAPHYDASESSPRNRVATAAENIGMKFRDVLDRVDIMGYGPTHPRVAVVVVGNDKDNLVMTVESVFGNTDMDRIFVVCVVVDGHDEDKDLVRDLEKIDHGAIPHWHGLRPDLHSPGQKEDESDEDPHGQKVHVMFNSVQRGVAESRKDAVDFIQLLARKHEEAGLKAEEEDLILLLLQSGAQLTSRRWLPPVTQALIVPPPILGKDDTHVAMKLANAVAFNLEGPGKRTSFDATFTPVISEPHADELTLSNAESYPAPALNGAAVALRLQTYANLPLQDLSLKDTWTANLDLSLNLWLCADGIDQIKDVEATAFEQIPPAPLPPEGAARFAAAWMDEVTQNKFFNAYTKSYPELTHLEWETLMAKARDSPYFTKDLARKCRSFTWYAQEINTDLNEQLQQVETVERRDKDAAAKLKGDDNRVSAQERINAPDKPLAPPEVKEKDDAEDVSIPDRRDHQKPSKPLCDECLQIVQKAKPVDIAYVDVANGHKDHPHLGARDERGNLGYIHDETALHENPEPFQFEGDDLRSACLKRDNNYRMLHEKVFVDLKYDQEAKKSGKKRDKIFCLVYTIDSGHPKIPAIRQTWGSKCDGFMVASNKTDASLGTIHIPHEGPETYNNIWQKVRSMWSYVYDNYYDKYDWFHIGGDDLYLIVENLRLYLESEEIRTAANGGIYLPDGDEMVQTPLFLGRRFAYQGDMEDIFNSGGSGYTLNKAALKTLVVEGFTQYFPHAVTFSEDTMVARIFRHFGVYPYETKDENGGERYMPFLPGHHYGYRMPQDHDKDWYANYSINIKEGPDHCSARSVAFHYVKGDMMKRLHALLYRMCPADTQ